MAYFSLNSGGDPVDPQDYTLQASQPSCSGSNQICAIQAANDGNNHPELTESVKDQMIKALNNRTSNATVSLKS
ncbi:hypothetical protein [Sphingobacterium anhuiense]|uniref:hypothetical protein n=1 Tax=Sphingobacterium anhuiense TaxID=493780 RepID=UPI003C30492C